MKAKNLRILAKLRAKRRQKPSGLFDRLDLIKDAWEVFEYGVPTIIKALRDDGATEGVSLSNVQGFLDRAREKGLIGEKGCRKAEKDLNDIEESPDEEHSDPPAVTGKKEAEGTALKKKPKGPSSKSTQAMGAQIVPKRHSPPEKEHITLPEKGPIAQETWLAFAESQGYPLDSAGNIDVKKYAQLLDQEGVKMLEDSDYQLLAGFTQSWRAHPERNISETWAANVAQKAATLKRQIRRAVGLA